MAEFKMGPEPETTFSRISAEQLEQLMRARHSLFPRQFTGEEIEDEIVKKILDLANTAPSHKRTFPWRFVVQKGESLNELMDLLKDHYLRTTDAEKVQNKKLEAFEERKSRVSHVVSIIMKRDPQARVPEWEEIAAVSCAVQNIYLSLNTFGIGGYWSTGRSLEDDMIRQHYNLDKEDLLLGYFYLGKVQGEFQFPDREPAGDKIIWKR